MTDLLITYADDGSIEEWRYATHDDYDLADDEMVVDPEAVDHRDLNAKRIDTTASPPTLVDDPEFRPSEIVDRGLVSSETRQTFRDAQDALDAAEADFEAGRDAEDVQAQLDALASAVDALDTQTTDLYAILTGKELQ